MQTDTDLLGHWLRPYYLTRLPSCFVHINTHTFPHQLASRWAHSNVHISSAIRRRVLLYLPFKVKAIFKQNWILTWANASRHRLRLSKPTVCRRQSPRSPLLSLSLSSITSNKWFWIKRHEKPKQTSYDGTQLQRRFLLFQVETGIVTYSGVAYYIELYMPLFIFMACSNSYLLYALYSKHIWESHWI